MSVPTEEYTRRFEKKSLPYRFNDLEDVNWSDDVKYPDWLKQAFYPFVATLPVGRRPVKHTAETISAHLANKMIPQIDRILEFGIEYHAEDEVFLVFNYVLSLSPLDTAFLDKWIENHPSLVFAALRAFPPDDTYSVGPELASISHTIVRNIIRSANEFKIAALVALEKISKTIAFLDLEQYFDLLMLSALCVRSQQLVQEVLLILNDARLLHCPKSLSLAYGHKHAPGIAADRAEEASDECPCNEDGRPRRQRTAPAQAKLKRVDDSSHVMAAVRVDAKTAVRFTHMFVFKLHQSLKIAG